MVLALVKRQGVASVDIVESGTAAMHLPYKEI